MKTRTRRLLLIVLAVILALGLVGIGAVFAINGYVVHTVKDRILTVEEASSLTDVDCILVLGCKVNANGVPSAMLEDRLRRSVELFQAGAAPKLLMSGDHGTEPYNEVQTMKQYALENGIASSDVFMDHAGFSTYESIYRAKEVFQADKILIVTQQYHLYRALYVAEALGVEAYGVSADYRTYVGQTMRDIREILARNKDFFTALFQPEPTYLGPAIPVSGDGDLTND